MLIILLTILASKNIRLTQIEKMFGMKKGSFHGSNGVKNDILAELTSKNSPDLNINSFIP